MSDDAARGKLFNCDKCRESEEFNEKVCWFYQDTAVIAFPVWEKVGKSDIWRVVPNKSDIYELTPEEFLTKFIEMEKHVRGDPDSLEILRDSFPQICPKSFFYDSQVGLLFDMESAAENYKALPYSQNYIDNPNQIVEGFDLIREIRNKDHQKKMKEMDSKSKADAKNFKDK